ncbi:MAG TPA: hypothetical protein VHC90_13970 [Bryobacteraceae bacterium]|nr:hypothetical protein [Bryobacteraceae bacterium]
MACLPASAQTAGEIMFRVAENQTRSEAARSAWVYRQDVLVRLLRSGGKLAREEDRQYIVTPSADGFDRDMVRFAGKYSDRGQEFAVSKPGEEHREIDLDASIAEALGDSIGGDNDARDGVSYDFFPLSAEKQKHYVFKLKGTEIWRGRNVFRITFEPLKNKDEDGGPIWAGEVLIDKTDFAPVLITTHQSRGVPLAVKTLLGTNLRQLGFKITYQKFDNSVWFPASYSGEFKLRALFLYSRTISMGLVNSDFRHADVDSKIQFENPELSP